MNSSLETHERRPWTVSELVANLHALGPLDVREPLTELHDEARALSAALRAAMPALGGKSRVTAAALLLLLQDGAGRDVFLDALASSDPDVRDLAIEYVLYEITPHDAEGDFSFRTKTPISIEDL